MSSSKWSSLRISRSSKLGPQADEAAGQPARVRKVHHAYSDAALHRLSSHESLNLSGESSQMHREARALQSKTASRSRERIALLVTLGIGVSLALVSRCMVVAEGLIHRMLEVIDHTLMGECDGDCGADTWALSGLCFVGSRLLLVLVAAMLTAWEPNAAGSGMSSVKSNLNGADLTGYLTRRTLFAKAIGITLVVSTSLPLGKEGPMVHIGACVAAVLSRSAARMHSDFRQPASQRDWASMGAAAGIAAAFNAPLGGILYSFEEVSSSWSMHLTWRSFVCVVAVSVAGRFFRELPHHLCSWGGASDSFGCGLFGSHDYVLGLALDADHFKFDGGNIFLFMLVAALGGALGGSFNRIIQLLANKRERLRGSYGARTKRRVRFAEAVILSAVTFAAFFALPAAFSCTPCPAGYDCATHPGSGNGSAHGSVHSGGALTARRLAGSGGHAVALAHYACPSGEYSPMASLLHAGHEGIVKHLYRRDVGHSDLPISVLLVALFVYFLLASSMLGVALPHGSFIPGMIIGALSGRLAGELFYSYGLASSEDRGVYALVGSAAMLGGMTRMTLTLSAVLVEVTGDVEAMPIIMLALAVSSAVASRLSPEALDHILIHLTGLPYLDEEPPQILEDLVARDVMSPRVQTLPQVCQVKAILKLLNQTTHNGFPVVRKTRDGPICGMVLRRQLLLLLHERAWEATRGRGGKGKARMTALRDRYVDAHDMPNLGSTRLVLSEADREMHLDLSLFMDPSPNLVFEVSPLPHVYHLFNKMGVRHVCVVNSDLSLVGIITRKDTFPELVERRLVANYAVHLVGDARRKSADRTAAGQLPDGTPSTSEALARRSLHGGLPPPTSQVSQPPRPNLRWQGALKKIVTGASQERPIFSLTYASVLQSPSADMTLGIQRSAATSHGWSRDATTTTSGGTPAPRPTDANEIAIDDADYILAHIVATSCKNNPRREISGTIYYNRQTCGVVQILEGPEAAVRSLYADILADPRHRGCEVLKEQYLATRQHEGFGMAMDLEGLGSFGEYSCGGIGGNMGGSMAQYSPRAAGGLMRLQYSSTLRAGSEDQARNILEQITASALRHNAGNGIGGMLSYDPTTMGVMQLLEGPKDAVRSLYHDIIAIDDRHTNVRLVEEVDLASEADRAFKQSWGLLQECHREGETLAPLGGGSNAASTGTRCARASSRLKPMFDTRAAAAATKRIADADEMRKLIDLESKSHTASRASGNRRVSTLGVLKSRISKEAKSLSRAARRSGEKGDVSDNEGMISSIPGSGAGAIGRWVV